ncbi:MAG: acetoacetate decarboxylase family protein [Proteobacteria bacterium]|nr:acetoacetate decarboxylase family protein [Pseudomonadota bacterium]
MTVSPGIAGAERTEHEPGAQAWGTGRLGWGGRASFSGAMLVVAWPRSAVERLLPEPLALCPQLPEQRPGTHPLLFTLGELSSGGGHLAGFDLSFGVRYRELSILAPFVAHPASPEPVAFACTMYADDPNAVLLGNAVYGYRKQLADIHWAYSGFRVARRGWLLFECTASVHGSWARDIGSVRRAAEPVARLTRLPVLGQRSDGVFVTSQFRMEFSGAEMRPMKGQVLWRRGDSTRSREGLGLAARGLVWRTGRPQVLAAA